MCVCICECDYLCMCLNWCVYHPGFVCGCVWMRFCVRACVYALPALFGMILIGCWAEFWRPDPHFILRHTDHKCYIKKLHWTLSLLEKRVKNERKKITLAVSSLTPHTELNINSIFYIEILTAMSDLLHNFSSPSLFKLPAPSSN